MIAALTSASDINASAGVMTSLVEPPPVGVVYWRESWWTNNETAAATSSATTATVVIAVGVRERDVDRRRYALLLAARTSA